jgi:hypothetical protein
LIGGPIVAGLCSLRSATSNPANTVRSSKSAAGVKSCGARSCASKPDAQPDSEADGDDGAGDDTPNPSPLLWWWSVLRLCRSNRGGSFRLRHLRRRDRALRRTVLCLRLLIQDSLRFTNSRFYLGTVRRVENIPQIRLVREDRLLDPERARSYMFLFVLRCWRTLDGDVLVEQPVVDDLPKFYVLRAGCVWHTYGRNRTSLDDSLYMLVYEVIDNRLACTMTEEVRCEERSRSTSTELAGLVRLPDMTAEQLQVAIARTRD